MGESAWMNLIKWCEGCIPLSHLICLPAAMYTNLPQKNFLNTLKWPRCFGNVGSISFSADSVAASNLPIRINIVLDLGLVFVVSNPTSYLSSGTVKSGID